MRGHSRLRRIAHSVAVCAGCPALAVVALFGQGTVQLLGAVATGALVLLAYCWLDRSRLHLSELSALRPR